MFIAQISNTVHEPAEPFTLLLLLWEERAEYLMRRQGRGPILHLHRQLLLLRLRALASPALFRRLALVPPECTVLALVAVPVQKRTGLELVPPECKVLALVAVPVPVERARMGLVPVVVLGCTLVLVLAQMPVQGPRMVPVLVPAGRMELVMLEAVVVVVAVLVPGCMVLVLVLVPVPVRTVQALSASSLPPPPALDT